MTFELRFVVVVLAAFAWSSVAGAWIVAALWRRPLAGGAAERAAALVRLRLLPPGVGLVVATLAAIAYYRFEPRGIDESTGMILAALALTGAAFAGHSLVRVARLSLRTRKAVRQWMQGATPVELPGISVPALAINSDFPVVAVVGLFRPRLLIARSVLGACTDEELQAILTHEQGHIERSDNLRRLALGAAPDVLSWLPVSRRIQSAWLEAAEDAADDDVGRLGSDGRAVLAQALVRVAQLAVGTRPVTLPSSTLFRGENGDLERRVRRLLSPAAPAGKSSPHPTTWVAVCGATLVALFALEDVHNFVEAAVNYLP